MGPCQRSPLGTKQRACGLSLPATPIPTPTPTPARPPLSRGLPLGPRAFWPIWTQVCLCEGPSFVVPQRSWPSLSSAPDTQTRHADPSARLPPQAAPPAPTSPLTSPGDEHGSSVPSGRLSFLGPPTPGLSSLGPPQSPQPWNPSQPPPPTPGRAQQVSATGRVHLGSPSPRSLSAPAWLRAARGPGPRRTPFTVVSPASHHRAQSAEL